MYLSIIHCNWWNHMLFGGNSSHACHLYIPFYLMRNVEELVKSSFFLAGLTSIISIFSNYFLTARISFANLPTSFHVATDFWKISKSEKWYCHSPRPVWPSSKYFDTSGPTEICVYTLWKIFAGFSLQLVIRCEACKSITNVKHGIPFMLTFLLPMSYASLIALYRAL